MNTPRASKLSLINRIVGRVASSFGRSPSDIQLTEHEDRRLHLEILESRILYSGSPAPAPEAPAEVVEATESQVSASSPTNAESNDTGETGDVELAQETESVDAEANPTVLTQEALLAMVDAATQRWIDSGISDAQIDALESATYQIADLGDNRLGLTSGSTVSIDDDAGGTGAWFIDETPLLDEEFRATETNLMVAPLSSDARGHYDFLSVVLHEQGHLLGLPHSDVLGDLMEDTFDTGQRRLPTEGQAADSIPGTLTEDAYASLSLPTLVINEILADPAADNFGTGATSFNTNRDGFIGPDDEFIEVINTSGSTVDVSGLEFWDSSEGLWFTVPNATTIEAGGLLLVVKKVGSGTLPTVAAGGIGFDANFDSSLFDGLLNDGGDVIRIYDRPNDEFIEAQYGSPSAFSNASFSATATQIGTTFDFGATVADGSSVTLFPDGDTGSAAVDHATLGSGSYRATPGTLASAPKVDIPTYTQDPIVLNEFVTNSYRLITLPGISIEDLDGDSAVDSTTVTITIDGGDLSVSETEVGGLTAGQITGQETNALTLTGTLDAINATLGGGLTVTQEDQDPDFNDNFVGGISTITITATDLDGNSGFDTTLFSFAPTNDPPSVTAPTTQSTLEDTPLVFSSANGNQITVADPDAGELPGTDNVRVSLSVVSGTLTLATTANLDFATDSNVGDGTADSSMIFRGALADVNAALDGLSYVGNLDFNTVASADELLTIVVNDLGNTGQDPSEIVDEFPGFEQPDTGDSTSEEASATVTISVTPVNDAPVNNVPTTELTDNETALTFNVANGNQITITDVDVDETAAPGNTLQVSLSVNDGILTLSQTTGLTFDGGTSNGQAAMTFTGNAVDINAALDGLQYTVTTPGYVGTANLVVTTDDLGNTGIDTTTPFNSDFDIELDIGAGFTAAQIADLNAAAARWEEIIVGDLPDEGAIDDIRISVIVDTVDGAGGTVATGGVNDLRASSNLPYTGTVTFDTADLADTTAAGDFLGVSIHEIGHALGAGGLWDDPAFNLVASGPPPTYVGSNAIAAHNFTFDASATELALDGDEAHWDETTYGSEIMTPTLESGSALIPISVVTIGSLQDLGYTVEYRQADEYNGKDGYDFLAALGGGALTDQDTIAITVTVNAPDIVSFSRQTPSDEATNADTLIFRAVFDEVVQNVDAADFVVTGTTATISNVSAVDGQTYDITITGGDLTGLNGSVGLDLSGGQDIIDLTGYALPNTEPPTDQTYTVDNTDPTANIVDVSPDPRNTDAGTVSINFSESVTGVGIEDFTLTRNSNNVDISGLSVSGSGDSYTIDLSTVSGTAGDYVLTLVAANSDIRDAAGNLIGVDASDTWLFNGPPTDISLSADTIAENTDTTGGAVAIGNLSATDPNTPSTHTFTLVAGSGDADNGKFEIFGSELRIRQNETIDFEAQSTYSVRVNVNDGLNDFSKVLSVSVTDVNESPTDITLNGNTIAENTDTSGGPVAIGTLNATDPENNANTFTLVAGTGDTDNAKFEIVGGVLSIRQDEVIDFEAQPSYSIRVNVNDGDNDFPKVFSIGVTDLNEAATDISLSTDTIAENTDTSGGPVAIGNLSATDPENNANTFTLVSGTGDADNAKFEIVGGELRILQNETIDFEAQSSYSVRVNVNDGLNDFAKVLNVGVVDVNEAPTDIILSANTIAENTDTSGGPVSIGNLSATDPENNANTFTLVAGTGDADNAKFEIVGGVLSIRQDEVIDFETQSSYSVRVNVNDGANDFPKVFSIGVTDLNDSPTDIALSSDTIVENTDTSGGAVAIGNLSATDPENNANTFTLVAGTGDADNARFEIVGGELRIRQNEAIDFETQSNYSVRVNVNDGLNDFAKVLNVGVVDVNEAPTDITLSSNTIAENTDTSGSAVAIGNLSATDPENNANTFTLVAGTGDADNAKFEIVGGELRIRQNEVIDFETQSSYSVRVNVNDGLSDFAKVFSIGVTDLNESPTDITLSANTIVENTDTSGGAVAIGNLSATDPENNANTFTLVTGTGDADNAKFEIVGGELRVRQNEIVDFEAQSSYSVRVNVNDGLNDFSKVFSVSVTDVNESPTDITLSSNTIAENTDTSGGAVAIGNLSATDPENNASTFSLIAGTGDADNAKFEIVGGELRIRQNEVIDFETQSSYSVRVNVNDGANDFAKVLSIGVGDVNEAPDPADGSFNVAETAANGTSVATVAPNDPDAGETHTFGISSGNTGNAFAISSGGEVTVADNDALTQGQVFNLVVDVTDQNGSGLTGSATLTITVTDVNTPPTAVTLDNAVSNLAENTSTASDVFIADISITDDGSGTNNVTLSGSDAAFFTVFGGQLFLMSGAVLDFEAPVDGNGDNAFEVTVDVDDSTVGTTPDVSTSFTLNITNVNEGATDISLSANTIAENTDTSGGAVAIGSLSATDPESNANTFSLVAGSGDTDNAKFEIVGGELRIRQNEVIDFESQPSYSIRINVNDGANDFAEVFTVNVSDLNESPTDITLSAGTIAENTDTSGGAVAIGTLSATDPENNANTFTLVSGTGDTDNAKFEIVSGELRIRQGETIDFETQSSYSVRINVNDGVNDFAEVFSIGVTDQNEAPTSISLGANTIGENTDTSGSAVAIGTLSATDPENNPSTFTLVAGTGDADNAKFEIVGGELRIRQGETIDFETQSTYSVRVNANDGANDFAQALSVSVTDVNESPTDISLSANTIAENTDTSGGAVAIGTLSATDPENNANTFTLVAGTGDTDNAKFGIVGGELRIRQGEIVDFEAQSSYSVRVNVNDGANDFAEVFTVNVSDLNESPTDITLSANTIAENTDTSGGAVAIGTLSATDPENNANSFTLVAGSGDTDNAKFEIVSGELRIRQGETIDFETQSSYSVRINVNDGANDFAEVFSVGVNDLNEAPTDIDLSSSVIANNADTSAGAVVVGTLSATDPESNASTFTLVAGTGDTDNAKFEIVGDELRIRQGEVVDILTQSSYSVRINANDGLNDFADVLIINVSVSGIDDQTMVHNEDTLLVNLNPLDPSGTITFTAMAFAPGEAAAYDLTQQYGFFPTGNDYFNVRGAQEKYFRGDGGANWYYILPNGDVHRLEGGSLATSPQVGTLDVSFYSDPSGIFDAAPIPTQLEPQQTAYNLDQAHDFYTPGNYYFNVRGAQEKYVRGDGGTTWYYILPNGDMHRLVGSNLATSPLVGTLDASYYDDPTKLFDVPPLPAFAGTTLDITNGMLTIDPPAGEVGNFTVRVTGSDNSNYEFNVEVTNEAPILDPIPDQTMVHNEDDVSVDLNPLSSDADGDLLTSTVMAFESGDAAAYDLNQQYGFFSTGNDYFNVRGAQEKYFRGDGGANWYYILPNGEVHRLVGSNLAISPLVGTLEVSFYDDPSRIFDAAPLPTQVDPAQQTAYDLDQAHDFYTPGNYYFNVRGAQEKYVRGDGGTTWYYILPNGDMHRLVGSNLATSPLVGTLDASYYDDPTKLFDVPPIPAFAGTTLDITNGMLTIDPPAGVIGGLSIRVDVSDGVATATREFNVEVTNQAPTLDPIPDQTMVHNEDDVSVDLNPLSSDADGDALTFTAMAFESGDAAAYDLNQQYGFFSTGNDYFNVRGAQEKYFRGDGGANWYYILPNGEVHRLVGSNLAISPLVGTLDVSFYDDPSSIFDAAPLPTQVDPAQQTAYDLDQAHDFYTPGNYYFNVRGAQEKYVRGDGGTTWYYILPNGDMHRLVGSNLATSPLVGTLDASYYDDPTKLFDVPPIPAFAGTTLDITNGVLTIDPPAGVIGGLSIRVSASDGVTTTTREFNVEVTNQAPTLDPIPDQVMNQVDDTLDVDLNPLSSDADGDSLTFTAMAFAPGDAAAYDLNQQYGFFSTGNDYFNVRGAQEKYFRGDGGANWYYILPSGDVHRLEGGSLATSPQVGTLDVSFYNDPSGIFDAAPIPTQLDQAQQTAYNLDQAHDFYTPGNYYFNVRGAQEKYVRGDGGTNWYYILPNGDMHRLVGSSLATSPLVGTLDTSYYDDPTKLFDVPPVPAFAGTTLNITNGVLTIDPPAGEVGSFSVRVTASDGISTTTREFNVDVNFLPVLPVLLTGSLNNRNSARRDEVRRAKLQAIVDRSLAHSEATLSEFAPDPILVFREGGYSPLVVDSNWLFAFLGIDAPRDSFLQNGHLAIIFGETGIEYDSKTVGCHLSTLDPNGVLNKGGKAFYPEKETVSRLCEALFRDSIQELFDYSDQGSFWSSFSDQDSKILEGNDLNVWKSRASTCFGLLNEV